MSQGPTELLVVDLIVSGIPAHLCSCQHLAAEVWLPAVPVAAPPAVL